MKRKQGWLFGTAVLLLSLGAGGSAHAATSYRWDIVTVTFPPPIFILGPGGQTSAFAANGSRITLAGSGTFVVEEPDKVTGGGVWLTRGPLGNVTGFGAYQVTGLARFDVSPFRFPAGAFTDNVGKLEDVRVGLAFLHILYSDGSRGLLTVMCDTEVPNSVDVDEGITVTKGFVYYWHRDPPQPGINPNATLFHALP